MSRLIVSATLAVLLAACAGSGQGPFGGQGGERDSRWEGQVDSWQSESMQRRRDNIVGF